MDRAGIVGQDGATHHGLFDISFLRHIPNIIVCAPKDEDELRHLLYSATRYGHPTSVRYPRGACTGAELTEMRHIPAGEAEVLLEGSQVTILAIGNMVIPALVAALSLRSSGIKAGVVNARFVKPMDVDCVLKAATSADGIVTVEENALQGGFGSAVLEVLEANGVRCPVKRMGVPDEFVEHGTQDELRARYGLNAEGIERTVRSLVEENKKSMKIAF